MQQSVTLLLPKMPPFPPPIHILPILLFKPHLLRTPSKLHLSPSNPPFSLFALMNSHPTLFLLNSIQEHTLRWSRGSRWAPVLPSVRPHAAQLHTEQAGEVERLTDCS